MNNDEAAALMAEPRISIMHDRAYVLFSDYQRLQKEATHYRERAEKAEKLLAQALGLSCSAMSFLKEAQALKHNEGL